MKKFTSITTYLHTHIAYTKKLVGKLFLNYNRLKPLFPKGPQEESLFWTAIYFWDEIDKIRDSFKVMTFFCLHLNFGTNMTKSETVLK